MKSTLRDIWGDLRQKRLWPLAVVLLLALVAVPVVLSKPAEEPAPPPVSQANAGASKANEELRALAAVSLDSEAPEDASDLETFDSKNPFKPPEAALPKAPETEEIEVTESTTVDETVGGDETPSGGGGGTPTPTPQAPPKTETETETETTDYQFVADVTFTANGRTRHVKGMKRLDLLPSEASPLLLFLGVSTKGGNAVFLVDSTLAAAGEGTCKPSNETCSFLHLGPGSKHQFTNEEGDSYELRIDEIRKVKVVEEKSAAEGSRKAAAGKARAGAAVGSRRTFVPGLITDLLTESTTEKPASGSQAGSR